MVPSPFRTSARRCSTSPNMLTQKPRAPSRPRSIFGNGDAPLLRCGNGVLNCPIDFIGAIGRECGHADLQYRCRECVKSFERTETITDHDAAKVRCPKCNSKKVTQVPGRVHVIHPKRARGFDPSLKVVRSRSPVTKRPGGGP